MARINKMGPGARAKTGPQPKRGGPEQLAPAFPFAIIEPKIGSKQVMFDMNALKSRKMKNDPESLSILILFLQLLQIIQPDFTKLCFI